MFLTKYNSMRELSELEKRFVDTVQTMKFEGELAGFSPVVNTREGEYAYHIEADLPGVEKKDITVDVRDNVLTLSGERKHKKEVKKDDYYKLESSYGKFQRSFTLPKGVDVENIQAITDKGMLEVTIPKLTTEIHSSKKIEVK